MKRETWDCLERGGWIRKGNQPIKALIIFSARFFFPFCHPPPAYDKFLGNREEHVTWNMHIIFP